MRDCEKGHPWVKQGRYCKTCGYMPPAPKVIVPGPVVDIAEPGEGPCLMPANRAARRAAKAHAR